jgi:hypothetical protein
MPDTRSCKVCGPGRREGCFRCGARYGHHHLDVVDRDGQVVATVAACHVHGPRAKPAQQVRRQRRAAVVSRPANVRRDRERRAAQRVVLDRHAGELQQVLAEIRNKETT